MGSEKDFCNTGNLVVIGIDPGVSTGYAEIRGGALVCVRSPAPTALQAMALVADRVAEHGAESVLVVWEDARLIGGAGGAQRGSRADTARLMGAGSIRRDCQYWDEWLDRLKVPQMRVSPRTKGCKLGAAQFASLTGWDGPTNEHGRDAGVLAWRYRFQRAEFARRVK